jgi:hypothetical protein
MRVPPEQFQALNLEAHAVLADVPLRDVTAIDLPGGGSGRTIGDVRALLTQETLTSLNSMVRALFSLRRLLGRVLGWDSDERLSPESSYVHRLSDDLKARSLVPPGTAEGPFKLLYVLERESVAEARNATVHAFICATLQKTSNGYRLYWGIYVKPVSWLTPLYMATIEPFRRFVVYPSIFRRIRRAWIDRYCELPAPSDERADFRHEDRRSQP